MRKGTCTSKDYELFSLAMQIAELSQCPFRHGSLITRKRKPISIGFNILKSSASVQKLLRKLRNIRGTFDEKAEIRRNRSEQIHAEIVAILKAKTDLKNTTLYSARFKSNGLAGNSRPCESCAQIISFSKISCIVYWENDDLKKIFL